MPGTGLGLGGTPRKKRKSVVVLGFGKPTHICNTSKFASSMKKNKAGNNYGEWELF